MKLVFKPPRQFQNRIQVADEAYTEAHIREIITRGAEDVVHAIAAKFVSESTGPEPFRARTFTIDCVVVTRREWDDALHEAYMAGRYDGMRK
jgi:hypothetical protein